MVRGCGVNITYRVLQVWGDDHLEDPGRLGHRAVEVLQQHELVQGVVPAERIQIFFENLFKINHIRKSNFSTDHCMRKTPPGRAPHRYLYPL